MAPAAPVPGAPVPAAPPTAAVSSAALQSVEQATRTLITLLKKSKGRGAANTLDRAEDALAALAAASTANTSTALPGALLQDLVGCMRTTDSGALQVVLHAAGFLSLGSGRGGGQGGTGERKHGITAAGAARLRCRARGPDLSTRSGRCKH
jgi:hypothetical protein